MHDRAAAVLERRSERWCLAACIGLVAAYLAGLLFFHARDDPVDARFYRERAAVRTRLLSQYPARLGETYRASDGSRFAPQLALLEGWSGPEDWGVWTDGPSAELALAVALPGPGPGPARFYIRLTGHPFVGVSGRQSITAEVDGWPAGQWDLSDGAATLSLVVPEALAAGLRTLDIMLHIAQPTPPAHSDDVRRLGFGLQAVEISREP